MSIYVIGVNHKTAPVSIREKVYFPDEQWGLYLQDLLHRQLVHEAVLLSTCNRSELYCETDKIGAVLDWFCAQTTLSPEVLQPLIYEYHDDEAIAHMMRVACGLDSMVLGEPQILGQVKEAFSESCTAGAIGPLFHRLFQQIFSVAKDIRTTTTIGACPVSVASAAVHFAKSQFADFSSAKVALIGAGDTVDVLAKYLERLLLTPLTLINRSVEKAAAIAHEVGAEVFSLDELEVALAQADVVFAATGSPTPIVNKAIMASVMSNRAERPMMMVDIAVPRDIDPSVSELASIQLFCIDDLKAIIEQNRLGREHAADKAFELIRKRSSDVYQDLQSFDKVAHTIRAYRGQIEEICHVELRKAKQQLYQGVEAEEVMEQFARAFIQKLMHAPSVQLRQAGAAGRFDLLRFAKQLFSLPDPDIELT